LLGGAATGVGLLCGWDARADDVADTLAAITQARAGLKTLVAPFTQERTIGLLATAVKSEGEMTLVRPESLRWELKPPDGITYWITPAGFAYAGGAGSANAGKQGPAGRFGAVLADMLTLLGGDMAKLRGRYEISVPSRTNGVVLVAKPKAADVAKHINSLELTAGPELWTVKKVVIEEKNGDRSVIVFNKVDRDKPVDPAKMRPPKP
jgi:outer membrane lipoprotein-sorting protein